jgi:hypothetical protein
LIVSGIVVGAALIIYAQEAAPPSVDLYEEQPEATITPSPPPNGPELPELKQLDETFKPPSLGTDADATKLRVEWRQLKNRTVNDPAVQAAKAFAQTSHQSLLAQPHVRPETDASTTTTPVPAATAAPKHKKNKLKK